MAVLDAAIDVGFDGAARLPARRVMFAIPPPLPRRPAAESAGRRSHPWLAVSLLAHIVAVFVFVCLGRTGVPDGVPETSYEMIFAASADPGAVGARSAGAPFDSVVPSVPDTDRMPVPPIPTPLMPETVWKPAPAAATQPPVTAARPVETAPDAPAPSNLSAGRAGPGEVGTHAGAAATTSPPPARRLAVSRAPSGTPSRDRVSEPARTQSAAVARGAEAGGADARLLPIIPPTPLSGMETNHAPNYPAGALRRGEQGSVLLRVTVSTEGRPLEVSLARSSGHQALDEAALSALHHWRFNPATRGGLPVLAVAEVPVRFRLDN
jgi:periplasmic protein TonB